MKTIHFVILTWNSEKLIGRCLDSLLAFQQIRSIIYVVDNGSTDQTRKVIEEKKKNHDSIHSISIIPLEKNVGTTKSRNIALRGILTAAKEEDYICVLDSDTEVSENAIMTLIQELEKDPRNGIIGPQMFGANGELQLSARDAPTIKEKFLNVVSDQNLQRQQQEMQKQNKKSKETAYPVGYLLSACWLMRPSLLEKIGLLDERIFYAPEDAEFCIRAWKNGQRVLYCPAAKILHHWQRLSKKKLISKHNFEHLKGLAYLFIKHRYCFSAAKIKALMF